MQRVTLLCVGRLKEQWVRDACEHYLQRIKPNVSLTILELPASKGQTAPQQQAEETERLLRALERMEGEIWVLDERGKSVTSPAFAEMLGKAKDSGTQVTFVLGGAFGFTEAVRSKAHRVIRLSDMTLPHELARVLFLEQLYRAAEIQRGSGYHHV